MELPVSLDRCVFNLMPKLIVLHTSFYSFNKILQFWRKKTSKFSSIFDRISQSLNINSCLNVFRGFEFMYSSFVLWIGTKFQCNIYIFQLFEFWIHSHKIRDELSENIKNGTGEAEYRLNIRVFLQFSIFRLLLQFPHQGVHST